MKRVGDLYDSAFTRDALLAAYHAAARHKSGKRACFNFERRLSSNLDSLYCELRDGIYQPMPYYTFEVFEPKRRTIYAPAFRDLVVQHAIYAVANPIFDCTFIDQSYACRKGMGTHKAADYAQAALRSIPRDSYTLKTDVRKFFYRVDRGILRTLVERKIKDARFVDLMMAFADHGEPVGIPIGNLLSQLYALIYLNPMDQFVKRELRVKYYCRYVDDAVLFGLSKADCIDAKNRIEALLWALNLELSHYTIAPARKGVNFVGYRTWVSRRFIRKHSLYKFRKALKKGNVESVVSILGHARNTSSLQSMLSYIKKENYHENSQLQKTHHKLSHRITGAAC